MILTTSMAVANKTMRRSSVMFAILYIAYFFMIVSVAFSWHGRIVYRFTVLDESYEVDQDSIILHAREKLRILPGKLFSPNPDASIASDIEVYLEDEKVSSKVATISLNDTFFDMLKRESADKSGEGEDNLEWASFTDVISSWYKTLENEVQMFSNTVNDKITKTEEDMKVLQNEMSVVKEELGWVHQKNAASEIIIALKDLQSQHKLGKGQLCSGRTYQSFKKLRELRTGDTHYALNNESNVALAFKWAVLLAILENLTPVLRTMIEVDYYPWGKCVLDESIRHLQAMKLPKSPLDIEGVPEKARRKVDSFFLFSLKAVGLRHLFSGDTDHLIFDRFSH